MKEFDNLLNMLANSPEAIKQLNYTAFNEVDSSNSPLKDIDLSNLASEETKITTTVVSSKKVVG